MVLSLRVCMTMFCSRCVSGTNVIRTVQIQNCLLHSPTRNSLKVIFTRYVCIWSINRLKFFAYPRLTLNERCKWKMRLSRKKKVSTKKQKKENINKGERISFVSRAVIQILDKDFILPNPSTFRKTPKQSGLVKV